MEFSLVKLSGIEKMYKFDVGRSGNLKENLQSISRQAKIFCIIHVNLPVS